MNQEIVSIIIPMYNAEKYIKYCMDSIINQTYTEIEILVIDDASTDQSLKVAKEYERQDKRVKVLSFTSNKGADYVRKQGIKQAKGKYIMLVDADDWIDPTTVWKCMEVARKYDCDIVRFGMVREMLKQKRKLYFKKFCEEQTYIKKEQFAELVYPTIITTYNYNSMCGQLIRKEIMEQSLEPNELIMAEDLYFNLILIEKVQSIVLLPDYLYHYRYNENSITTVNTKERIEKKLKDIIFVYGKFFACAEKWKLEKKYEKIVALRILREITNQYLCLFLGEKLGKTQREKIEEEIEKQEIVDKIRKKLTQEDIEKCGYENKGFMMFIYNKQWEKLHRRANSIYRKKVKFKNFLKKLISIKLK